MKTQDFSHVYKKQAAYVFNTLVTLTTSYVDVNKKMSTKGQLFLYLTTKICYVISMRRQ